MDKVIRDSEVAVLYSPNFGAGWYSWHGVEELLFSPEIVSIIESCGEDDDKKYNEIMAYMEENYPDVYAEGARDLTITWLPKGTCFEIGEYDGHESVRVLDHVTWITA